MELPKVRRYRKGELDRLYVSEVDGTDLAWAETDSGEITIQIPGSEARVEAALNAWASSYPEDDLSSHLPGRHAKGLAAAWSAEIDAIEHDIVQLEAMRDNAIFQRDQYLKGESGEQRVGGWLNALYASGWGILHSIPVFDQGADIDHLLIGPGGVWTVNTKAHNAMQVRINGDQLTVGRIRTEYIASARSEAQMVASALAQSGIAVHVDAAVLMLLPRGAEIIEGARPTGVTVLYAESGPTFFGSLDPVLDQSTINRVFAVARRPATWNL